MESFSFKVGARRSAARTGIITTPHGVIQTPAFVPVGTKAGVKGILPELLAKLGAQAVLANTYHLYLQPGEKVVEQAGGLANFMDWKRNDVLGPTMTDSGGFQVFSLGAAYGRNITKIAKGDELPNDMQENNRVSVYDEDVQSKHGQLAIIDDEGVTFTSHLDGSLHRFTPERSIEIQHALGADMFFAFDECTAPTEPYEYQREAMERTHRWALRSLKAHRQNLDANRNQAIFGIVQGGRYTDLRSESAKEIASMDFDGFGIGGSFSKEDMMGALQSAIKELPGEKPRHFLGIGEPGDVLTGIAEGIDLFDCVAATRLGRHGTIYTKAGPINLTNEKFKNDFTPLDPQTVVPGTEGFTRAYVSHLLRANEILGQVIASLHNLGFILQLVDGARAALENGTFDTYREDFEREYYK
ncbi:MAG: tRNA guanosine(34) transglycosylase Tgt [Candidatus Pacebacteria bacterium]|nr:tRNA guanosine(34) transglycosylase Tgt [Candidatus Paceibacterota bacterium]